jgi:hypothetical protein
MYYFTGSWEHKVASNVGTKENLLAFLRSWKIYESPDKKKTLVAHRYLFHYKVPFGNCASVNLVYIVLRKNLFLLTYMHIVGPQIHRQGIMTQ